MTAVDMHTHFFPRAWPDFNTQFGVTGAWPTVEPDDARHARILYRGKLFRTIDDACWDVTERVRRLDRDEIALQVVSATPVLFGYDRPAEETAEAAQFFNDFVLEMAASSSGRLVALCQVPLQDTDVAIAELERCMAAGALGVHIGSHVGARNFDDPEIERFLLRCAQVGAAVLVHPTEMLGGDRTQRYGLSFTVGMPAETHLAIASLILGGGFDRLPPTLRICFAHGGGSFALIAGRMDYAWGNGVPGANGTALHPPSSYARRMYADTTAFDSLGIKLLIERFGPERVMLGSDAPFPLGEQRVGMSLRAMDLGERTRTAVLGDNARAFLGRARVPAFA